MSSGFAPEHMISLQDTCKENKYGYLDLLSLAVADLSNLFCNEAPEAFIDISNFLTTLVVSSFSALKQVKEY